MRARFDQFFKSVFREALSPAGTVKTQEEISSDAQQIDTLFEPDPARAHALDELGRLGDMARTSSVFEAFHGTVDIVTFRSCVRKQLTLDHVERNRAKREEQDTPPFPHLWVLSARRPAMLIDVFEFSPIPGQPQGFLQRSKGDAVGLVVVRDLPATRDTLILRLMGAGAVLDEALRELASLPEGSRERSVIVRSLIEFRPKIIQDPTDEEREFLMSTLPLYEQWEMQVKDQGRVEGRVEGQRVTLLDLLNARFGAVPSIITSRIDAANAADLSRWTRRVLSATTIEDVFARA